MFYEVAVVELRRAVTPGHHTLKWFLFYNLSSYLAGSVIRSTKFRYTVQTLTTLINSKKNLKRECMDRRVHSGYCSHRKKIQEQESYKEVNKSTHIQNQPFTTKTITRKFCKQLIYSIFTLNKL